MPKGNYDVEIPVFVRISASVHAPNEKKAYKEAMERIRAVFNTLPPGMHYNGLERDGYACAYIDGIEYDE